MVKKEKSQKESRYILIIVGGSIFISLFLGFLIGRPLYINIERTNQEIKERKLTLDKLRQNLASLQKLEEKKEELEKKNSLLIAAIPDDKDISRLFYQFEATAKKANVNITSVSEAGGSNLVTTSTPQENQPLPENLIITPISYQVVAQTNSYANLKEALSNIEASLRILSVDKVNINESNGRLNIRLTVNTYKRG